MYLLFFFYQVGSTTRLRSPRIVLTSHFHHTYTIFVMLRRSVLYLILSSLAFLLLHFFCFFFFFLYSSFFEFRLSVLRCCYFFFFNEYRYHIYNTVDSLIVVPSIQLLYIMYICINHKNVFIALLQNKKRYIEYSEQSSFFFAWVFLYVWKPSTVKRNALIANYSVKICVTV